jgi:hypothetical protein
MTRVEESRHKDYADFWAGGDSMAYVQQIIFSPFTGVRNAWNWAMNARARRQAIAYRVKLARDDNDSI